MPQYLAPDVYVEEIDSGNHPIEGVSTSVTGFVGLTTMGPATGLPRLVTSFSEFQSLYGSYFDFGPTFLGFNGLPYAAEGFFNNLGSLLYVSRVLPTGASLATGQSQGGVVTRLAADTPTPTAAQYKLSLLTTRGIEQGSMLELRMVKNGIVTNSANLTVASIDPATGVVTTNNPGAATALYESRYTTVFSSTDGIDANGDLVLNATPLTTRPAAMNSFVISAANEGSWGLKLQVTATHESAGKSVLDAFVSGAVNNNQIALKSTAGFYVNAWVEINRGNTKHYRKVLAVTGLVLTLDGPAMTALSVAPETAAPTLFATCEFRLDIAYGTQREQFSGLTLENVPGRYYFDVVNNGSSLITVPVPTTATDPFFFPSGIDGALIPLNTGGSDGTAAPTDATFIGQDLGPGKRTGIQALADIDGISIVAVPGVTSQNVQNAMITHCERLRYRFAILDPAPKSGNQPPDLNDIQNQRNQYDSEYAAIYYPRVLVYDPIKSLQVPAPPSGHMAGIYARVDDQRGVYKAPANEVIAGITDLETLVNKADQEILNPEPLNINVLRDFRHTGHGLRVYGARVITTNTNWKYINVRRLFNFIERSIEVGTQWAVFEPNDYRLWAKVTQSISQFLTRVWRDGGLMGQKAEQAFFVKCDSTTMTHDDIENGRLIAIVGIAPVFPAEFVIIRIGQWDGGSSVQEL
jgi:phage tail sheath protein FI